MHPGIYYQIYCSQRQLSRSEQREVDARFGALAAAMSNPRFALAMHLRHYYRRRHRQTFSSSTDETTTKRRMISRNNPAIKEARNAVHVHPHG